jgi:S-adenosylmethionine synthetase
MTSPRLLFTSESVTEGHPDKICDQISDAVLDACLEQDPRSRVACETATKTGFIMLLGEITTTAHVDFDRLVRKVVTDIGFDDSAKGFDGNTCAVQVAIGRQSPDIDMGVSQALEARGGPVTDEEVDTIGAGDQGMMFGFACRETDVLMPLPIYLAHRLTRRLAEARRRGEVAWLRPDGKAQVTIEYAYGQPRRVDTVLVSTQHAPGVSQADIRKGVIEHIIKPTLPPALVDDDVKIFVNPTGGFEVGGPLGDAGLTGRKIIVDTYGGMGRHGGGCFSGKDPSKVDRSAAYMGRYVAKNIVAAGIATSAEIQFAYAIGYPDPVSVCINTFGTAIDGVTDERIEKAVREIFSFKPAAIIRQLNLLRPIYAKTTNYGHFGKNDPDITWERTDKVKDLKRALKLS